MQGRLASGEASRPDATSREASLHFTVRDHWGMSVTGSITCS
jgi:hypothetical protein